MRDIALKLPQYFYLMMEKTFGCYFHVQSPYYQETQCNKKHLFLHPQGDRSGLKKPKKSISIDIKYSYHHYYSP